MHVEVHEAHLGVGDLGQCLSVDAGELEESLGRQACRQGGGDVSERLDVAARQPLEFARKTERCPDALDQLRGETGRRRRLGDGDGLVGPGQHLFDVAVGEATVACSPHDRVESVSARPQPRDDAGVCDLALRPAASERARSQTGDRAALDPAAESRRSDPERLRHLPRAESHCRGSATRSASSAIDTSVRFHRQAR
ncbi:hypothetical protein HRbin41_00982 [bacterium HR41]|nr:hypothetical protein HRbin41_00982 [bacterium HR41]